MRRIGFLVNPIAGMGGRVGLKGTDEMVKEARSRGAQPRSPDRARRALTALAEHQTDVTLLGWGDPMGASIAVDVGLSVDVIGHPPDSETTAGDTREAVNAFIDADVDAILFAGGDGTAVDIAGILDERDTAPPVLGIPAGVKVFSAVFAVTPEAAGEVIATFERTEQREVADLDEAAYREGTVSAELRGIVTVPVADALQSSKQMGGGSVEAVVEGVIAGMDESTTYFLGPGSTVGTIKDALEIDGTPLGVDIYRDGELVAADVAESELLAVMNGRTVIVVSPIGGQGFIFGRGNQQFSPDVIRRSDLEIIASPDKLDNTGVLRVDTGDTTLDEQLRGWTKVRIGRVERRMMEIV